MKTRKEKPWNRCDACGKFIPMRDFESGAAVRKITDPINEDYGTLCRRCHYPTIPPKP